MTKLRRSRGSIQGMIPIDLVLSADSNNGDSQTAFSYPLDESFQSTMAFQRQLHQLLRTDVSRCKSHTCQVCSTNHVAPTFIPTHKVDPSDIRRLPKRWWEQEEAVSDLGFFFVISNLFCGLFDDHACRCDDETTFSSSDITWLAGNLDSSRSKSESPEKDTSTDDDISSDDVSFYVREIRVIALADDDDSVPFDEH